MKTTVMLCSLFLLSACADNSSSDSTDAVQKSTSSNQFMTAAVAKIRAANLGMSSNQARCVVDQMTAGGQIGLGEINQMKLTQGGLQDNPSHMSDAYQSAVQRCQTQ